MSGYVTIPKKYFLIKINWWYVQKGFGLFFYFFYLFVWHGNIQVLLDYSDRVIFYSMYFKNSCIIIQ